MRFITRVLFLQLLVVTVVTAVFTALLVTVTLRHLEAEAQSTALAIARTVAADPLVRGDVARANTGGMRAAAEADLQGRTAAMTARTGALFIVVTDAAGLRLAHPDPARLDEQVSTDHRPVLEGHEITAWQTGTLGESARAKVPVRDPATDRPIGMVSVGFERDSVYGNLRPQLLLTAVAAAVALLIGAGAAAVFRRRWEKSTLGLQPAELVALVQNQEAVLDGVGDGVIAVDGEGTVRLANHVAETLLGVGPLTGRRVADLPLPADTRRGDGVAVGDRVLYLDSRPVQRAGTPLGEIIVLRDRTELVALTERLDSVRAMTSALRVQRHEFANRLHVASGLLEAGRVTEAQEFLAALQLRGPVDYPLENPHLVEDPFLLSFLGLTSMEAAERGVTVRVGEDSLLLGTVAEPEEVAAVLGNLVGNAVTAAAAGPAPAWVEVTVLQSGRDLVVTVADSGAGIAEGVDVFRTGEREEPPADAVHGHGIGLRLTRELLARRGGQVWVIDPGGDTGAVFGARIPEVMETTAQEEQ